MSNALVFRTELRDVTMKTGLILLLSLAVSAPGFAETWNRIDEQNVTRSSESPLITGDLPLVVAQSDIRGMNFDVYIRLETGMSEGELLLRAAKPDSESIENFRN